MRDMGFDNLVFFDLKSDRFLRLALTPELGLPFMLSWYYLRWDCLAVCAPNIIFKFSIVLSSLSENIFWLWLYRSSAPPLNVSNAWTLRPLLEIQCIIAKLVVCIQLDILGFGFADHDLLELHLLLVNVDHLDRTVAWLWLLFLQ